MELKGERLIPEANKTVWKALNDPEILRNCVPGCQSLEKTSDTEMVAMATIKVGPVSANFEGNISLSELNPPISYRITGEGRGGVAGFAKGSAFIRLEEADGGTLLIYEVDAQVGGKLAQLGGRLIDATARKLSEAFFEKFAAEIRRQYHGESPEPVTSSAAASNRATAPSAAAPTDYAQQPVGYPYPPSPPFSTGAGSRLPFLVALCLAATFAFLWLTERQSSVPVLTPPQTLSPEFSSAVQLILIATVGYLLGRLSNHRG